MTSLESITVDWRITPRMPCFRPKQGCRRRREPRTSPVMWAVFWQEVAASLQYTVMWHRERDHGPLPWFEQQAGRAYRLARRWMARARKAGR